MANDIKAKFGSPTALTITLNSLANSAAGVGRQSTLVDNSTDLFQSAVVTASIRVGTTPTANSLIYVYLLRSDNNGGSQLVDDGAGASDAALTVVNAPLLGAILVPAATSNATYTKTFDTSALGALGPEWGIAIVNSSGVALHASGPSAVSFIGNNQQVV